MSTILIIDDDKAINELKLILNLMATILFKLMTELKALL